MSHASLVDDQALREGRSGPQARGSWGTLYRVAALAAITIVVLVPIQVVVFVIWPPPISVIDYFATFQKSVLLGMLDLDVLLIVDELLTIPILLGLYVALRRTDPSLMTLGAAVGLISVVLFVVSREATLSMLALSQQYASVTSANDRAVLVAAGQTFLTMYNGTAYTLGYFLGSLSILLISVVMLRSMIFGRMAAVAGVVAGVTGLVPPTVGLVGMALAFISLLPMVVWLVLIARGFVHASATD
jgi:hypothetical protein